MSNLFTIVRQQYPFVKGLTWAKIDEQIEFDKTHGYGDKSFYHKISEETDLVTGCHEANPGLIRNIQVNMSKFGYSIMHIYSSRYRTAKTMGRHKDDQDVVIVQSLGRMKYRFDDDSEVIISPGDALYIPKEVYHDPIHIEPRITCSFSK
jgi:uncharacterized RmlC-like cupin family protein